MSLNSMPSTTTFSTLAREISLNFSNFSSVAISSSCSSEEPCSLKSDSMLWNLATDCSSIRLAGIWSMEAISSSAAASFSLRMFSEVPPSPSTALRTSSSSSCRVMPSRMRPASSSSQLGSVLVLSPSTSTSKMACLPDMAAPGPLGLMGKVMAMLRESPTWQPTRPSIRLSMNLPFSSGISTWSPEAMAGSGPPLEPSGARSKPFMSATTTSPMAAE
mmetsp:Transcript_454/g.663  ORF Transcript_454/g.663 Transcript_454/m.663 type:complete len:218 (+) Transcript_454:427-1080(+)